MCLAYCLVSVANAIYIADTVAVGNALAIVPLQQDAV